MAKKREWEQRDAEPSRAYQAFLAYRDMGPGRSLAGSLDPGGDRPEVLRTIERWSSRYRWIERCRAWDAWIQRERDRIARQEAAKWERRKLRALDTVYEDVQVLREQIRRMLSFPLSRRRFEDEDGQRITVVEPARWSWREIIVGLKAVAEIEAMVLTAATRDPEQMSDAELAGVLDALDIPEAPPAGAA